MQARLLSSLRVYVGGLQRTVAVAITLLAGACGSGGYDVVIDFEPPGLAADVERIELAVVADCASQMPLGEPATGALAMQTLRRGGRTAPLGEVDAGSYGLYARGIDMGCMVVATGCADVQLSRGGKGELRVTLGPMIGPGCGPGLVCRDGDCVTPGMDAGMDAARDSGVDAPMDGAPPDADMPDAAPPEECNGEDEDFDGRLDEAFECVQGTTLDCTTACGTRGTDTCGADCARTGDCTPAADADAVALWRFDGEATVTAFADDVGAHDGTIVGGDAAWVAGPLGCGDALGLAGTAGLFGEVANSPDWDITRGSVDLFVRFDAAATAHMGVISRDANGAASPGHLSFWREPDGTLYARLQTAAGEAIRCTTTAAPVGEWLDVSLRFGAPDFDFVVDGFAVATSTACTGSTDEGIAGNENPWAFGATLYESTKPTGRPAANFLDGAIDHVLVRNDLGSVGAPRIVRLVLVDADTDRSLGVIDDGADIDLAALGATNVTVRADVEPSDPGSVVFLADGAEAHIENNDPFGIAGDDPEGDYTAWADAIGTHTVTITAYDAADGEGTPGPAFISTFTLR